MATEELTSPGGGSVGRTLLHQIAHDVASMRVGFERLADQVLAVTEATSRNTRLLEGTRLEIAVLRRDVLGLEARLRVLEGRR